MLIISQTGFRDEVQERRKAVIQGGEVADLYICLLIFAYNLLLNLSLTQNAESINKITHNCNISQLTQSTGIQEAKRGNIQNQKHKDKTKQKLL
jgi:hypothetical protein